jgi:2'-5' RNA ligase
MFSKVGDTTLVLLVPEAESIVGKWRATLDPAAAEGMPAHITVLYPFIPIGKIDAHVLGAIRDMCDRHLPIELEFRALGEFPGVVWVDPNSEECTRLLEAARASWPEQVPYGKPNLKPIPHLTVTDGAHATDEESARTAVLKELPFKARITALALMGFDGQTWVVQHEFPLGHQVSTGSNSLS